MAIDRKAFFDAVRQDPFGGSLSGGQVDGLNRILEEWERRGLTDLRWLANILGQSFWESARTMQPIREGGGETYLRSKKYYPWVGEGLIQVTWEDNHRKFGATAPGQLMTWPIALRALFDGMIKGMFTGKKLADYFNDTKTDWVNARKIVNGLDKANEIAAISKQFYKAVTAAVTVPVPMPVPPPPDIPKPINVPVPVPKPQTGPNVGGAAGGAVVVGGGVIIANETAKKGASNAEIAIFVGLSLIIAIAVGLIIRHIFKRK